MIEESVDVSFFPTASFSVFIDGVYHTFIYLRFHRIFRLPRNRDWSDKKGEKKE